MSLEAIIKEIKEITPFSTEDVESGNSQTMNARRGRKNQAIERLKQLRRQYKSELLGTAVFIVVAGSKGEELTKELTGEKINLFSADPEQFYKDVASRVHPSLYQGKSTVVDLFDVLGRHLEDKNNELDIVEHNQLIFKERYVQKIDTLDQLTKLVRTAINEQMGAEIAGIQAVASVVDKAVEQGHNKKTTSIVLNTTNDELTLDILEDFERLNRRGARTFLVVAGKPSKTLKPHLNEDTILIKDVDEESIQKALETLKASMKRRD